jgi:hypothetical protein
MIEVSMIVMNCAEGKREERPPPHVVVGWMSHFFAFWEVPSLPFDVVRVRPVDIARSHPCR